MKRLLTTLMVSAAILLTSCGSDASNDDKATTSSRPSATDSARTTAAASTDPAFLGGCSAVSVYVQQRVQSGETSTQTAGADFLKIVENDPSYQAMSESEKELFRQGIEAGAAGSC